MKLVKWISVAAILVAVVLFARALPIDTAVDQLERWVDQLGVAGPVVFGLFYLLAALLLDSTSPKEKV